MKRFITKKQLDSLIKSYSFKKNEFRLASETKDSYLFLANDENSQLGIVVSSFFEYNQNLIKVDLCGENGKIYCSDFYKVENGELILLYRKAANEPQSSELLEAQEYINNLKNELYEQMKFSNKLAEEIREYKNFKAKMKEYNELKKWHKLNSGTNPRNAGRHKSKTRKEQIRKMEEMLNQNLSKNQIMEELKISQRTFYRYKKEINGMEK